MPFGSRRKDSDASIASESSTGTSMSNGDFQEDFAEGNKHTTVAAVLKAIEFECRLKHEWNKARGTIQEQYKRRDADDDEMRSQGKRFFEHFVVCGLPPDADVVAAAVSSKQTKNARQSTDHDQVIFLQRYYLPHV